MQEIRKIMAFGYFSQELAIDLGTANTLIMINDKVVLDQPSIVAIDNKTEKMIALGAEAKLMQGKVNPTLRTVRPLKDGVIADFSAAEKMIRGFIAKATGNRKFIFSPNYRIVMGIPGGSTEVEIRAVRDSTEAAGAREVFLIYEPMAAALGVGLNVLDSQGNMIVDIGGGTAEIAVISLGGIVIQDSIKTAGDVFTSDIIYYLRQQYNMKVGETTAEQIKIKVGSALEELEDEPAPFIVTGQNNATTAPLTISVTYHEIANCLDKSITRIETAIAHTLEQTPPELYADIVRNGIYLSGGGALLRGIAKRFTDKIKIPFIVADDPLRAVARGTCIALKNADQYKFLMR